MPTPTQPKPGARILRKAVRPHHASDIVHAGGVRRVDSIVNARKPPMMQQPDGGATQQAARPGLPQATPQGTRPAAVRPKLAAHEHARVPKKKLPRGGR